MLRPSEYLIEAVMATDTDSLDFVEEYRTVMPAGMLSREQMQRNLNAGEDENLVTFELEIPSSDEVTADMIAVPIDLEDQRKDRLLPELLYVDANESTSLDRNDQLGRKSGGGSNNINNDGAISFDEAKWLANRQGKRLPSAMEYDAILESLTHEQRRESANSTVFRNLAGGVAEWTTTAYEYHGVGNHVAVAAMLRARVLKGYGDPGQLPDLLQGTDGLLIAPPEQESPSIGYRAVRSGAPRFVKP
jgi:hypothetical protein